MPFSKPDHFFMQQALAQAKQSALLGEVPVGAVLTVDDEIIASGHNQPILQHDPSAHAEIVALRNACKHLQNYRLPKNACMYVTLEPCTMCVGALVHARLSRLVFATTEPRAGAVLSQAQLLDSKSYNHQVIYEYGLYANESAKLLKDFFKSRR